MIEHIGEVATTDQYWDCECEKDFIRPKEFVNCATCGSCKDEQPDSRVNEVLALGFHLPSEIWYEEPVLKAKKIGLDWLRDNIDPKDRWAEDKWVKLSDEFAMNIYVDTDGKERATIYSISRQHGAAILEQPFEVI